MLDGSIEKETPQKRGKKEPLKKMSPHRKKRTPQKDEKKQATREKTEKKQAKQQKPRKAAASPRTEIPKESQAEKKKRERKIVLFRLSDEYYGIDVSKIDEIIDAHINDDITGMPDFVAGVISLRGESIPVISLNERFHLREREHKETSTVLITSQNGEIYGICIDELEGVIDIDTSSILAVPSIFSEKELEYFDGIIKHGKEIAALIDIECILNNYTLR